MSSKDRRNVVVRVCSVGRRLAFVSICLTSGCVPSGKPNPENRPVTPNEVTDFTTLYRVNCAGCHGADGTFGPAPPLADPLFVSIVPDSALLEVIRSGRAGTPMPAFARTRGGTLSDAQVQALAKGIKSSWHRTANDAAHRLPAAPPAYELASTIKPDSEQDKSPGAALFAKACAECHGKNGSGGDAGPLDDRAFLQLVSNQALRRIIITGRPDLGMPNFAEADGRGNDFTPLTSENIDHLVALLAGWREGHGNAPIETKSHASRKRISIR